jgi:hypothetical protein
VRTILGTTRPICLGYGGLHSESANVKIGFTVNQLISK